MLTLKTNLKKTFNLLLFTLMATVATAQMVPQQTELPSSYSDEELKQFVQAVVQVMNIQEESQMKMVETIEDNNISVDRFNEMLMVAQHQGEENIDGTEEEIIAFNNSIESIQVMQMQMQQEMMEAITEQGMDVMQYQNIMQSYEVDPEIKQKVDQLFSELE